MPSMKTPWSIDLVGPKRPCAPDVQVDIDIVATVLVLITGSGVAPADAACIGPNLLNNVVIHT